ncbi:MAG TPA: hypothetical protein VF765_05705 [Polyangiaceae bacterium]
MRGLVSVLLALVAAFACGCNATGAEQGGQALAPDPCDATKGGHTWTDLYTCYFGPQGRANCSAQAGCHVTPNSYAASISGFVCGATKEDCWFGMTHPIYVLQGVEPPTACDAGPAALDGGCPMPPADAGADAAPICSCYPSAANPYPPIVPTGGTSDYTAAYIWDALHVSSGTCTKLLCDNMPCGNLGQNCPKGTGAYVFTSDDMARIEAWIKEGAQDN